MRHPKQISDLVNCLAKLPGLGPKSATRLALYILKRPADEARSLAKALVAVKEEIHFCSLCHDYTDQDPCPRCADPKRDRAQICVVESPADLMVIESSGLYRGLYHVLGGVLNPLNGIGPEDLNAQDLLDRLQKALDAGEPIREVLLATGGSPEAESTLSYLLDRLRDFPVQITRLARGLPVGMDLEYVDGNTLKQALEFRREAREPL
ncbi:MAG: recombination mediator RecR [Deltaproteobacteria bacterium]|jgi:recombination protein RecR|nr:recombination mediator RecR [Deltaproteobacteria bacterium]